ncbi:hypothetical protein [Micromonospora carbonacea]
MRDGGRVRETDLEQSRHRARARPNTLAWITAHRRLARDYETYPMTSEAMIRWAALGGMLRRLTRGKPATRQQRRTFNTPD